MSFVDPSGEYTKDANAPGGYSCAEILKDNPGDYHCGGAGVGPAMVDGLAEATLSGRVELQTGGFRVARPGGGGSGKHVLVTESVSMNVGPLSMEVGVMLKVDPTSLESTEYVYVGVGPGVGIDIGLPLSGAVNTEIGFVDAGAELAGIGWQLSAFAAAGPRGATANVMGSYLPYLFIPPYTIVPTSLPTAASSGWSAGVGAGAGAMVTATTTSDRFLRRLGLR